MTSRISIHIPLTGYDGIFRPKRGQKKKFQSTYPSRGMTSLLIKDSYKSDISIHIPLTGYDNMEQVNGQIDMISIHIPLTGYDVFPER